jgi:acyl-CoA thioester hydrolase
MSGWDFSTTVDVRFRDCDPLGHANNAVYNTYLEVARFQYWRALFGDVSPRGTGFIVARMEMDYRAPADPGDALDVRLRVDGIGRSSVVIAAQIVRPADARVILDSRGVMVMYDHARGVSVPVPDDVRQRIERHAGREFPRPA